MEKGATEHRLLHRLAGEDRLWDIDGVVRACQVELAERPLNAPKQLASPLNEVVSHVGIGLALLPPLSWTLLGCEVPGRAAGPDSHRAVDQVWRAPEPLIVRSSIGQVVQFEIKHGGVADEALLEATDRQRRAHLRVGSDLWGDELLGQVTLLLGHPNRSTLHLADDPDTAIALEDTDLWFFPGGRTDW